MANRGRNTTNKAPSRDKNNLYQSQVRLQKIALNTDTLSVHDDSDLDAELFSPGPSIAPFIAKKKPGPKSRSSNDSNDINSMLLSIKADTAATRTEIANTRTELSNDIKRLSHRTDLQLKSVDARLIKHNNDIKSLFARVKECESKSNSSMPPVDIELRKQQTICNNISISNVPVADNENLFDIIRSILLLLGIAKFTVDDLVSAKRVANSKSRLIIAGFRDYNTKKEVLKKKTSRIIKASDLFDLESGAANPGIFINTQLTPFFSNLSYHGREAIAHKQIHSCWMANSGFLVKMTPDAKPNLVTNLGQLNQLIASHGCVPMKKRDRSSDGNFTSPSSIQTAKQPMLRTDADDTDTDISASAKALKLTAACASTAASAGDDDDVVHMDD